MGRSERIVRTVTAAVMIVAATPVRAEDNVITCAERVQTVAAKLSAADQIAGFVAVVGGPNSSQAWLQDVALFGRVDGKVTPLPGLVKGQRRIEWRFDGRTDVWVSCVYEAGITLHRDVGRPRSCLAAFLRSTDQGGASWGMDRAAFQCQ